MKFEYWENCTMTMTPQDIVADWKAERELAAVERTELIAEGLTYKADWEKTEAKIKKLIGALERIVSWNFTNKLSADVARAVLAEVKEKETTAI